MNAVGRMRRYTVVLTPDLDEGGYVATVPALPGCVTEGDTQQDALEMAKDAIRAWIASAQADGDSIPEETASPELAAVEV